MGTACACFCLVANSDANCSRNPLARAYGDVAPHRRPRADLFIEFKFKQKRAAAAVKSGRVTNATVASAFQGACS